MRTSWFRVCAPVCLKIIGPKIDLHPVFLLGVNFDIQID